MEDRMTTASPPDLQVGTKAPDFRLPSTSGQPVTHSSFAGRQNVLLASVPLAFTGVCTADLRSFRSELGPRRENAELRARIRSL
jgi:peroxiredoxin